MKKAIITEIIAALFILLFVYAATSKLMDYSKFRSQLGQSPMLSDFAGWVVWAIPLTEILISFILVSTRFRTLGLYASFSLMTLFTGYIIAITRFSTYVPCSCGGVLQHLSWSQHLVFNIFFMLLALIAILLGANDDAKISFFKPIIQV